ncbi:MAG: nucleotidyltransferase family protein [Thermoplasmata archaeon]
MVVGAILCGGYSRRLYPLTRFTPKVLLPLKNGYSIIEKQLNDFSISRIDTVYLLVGFKKEKIMNRFKKGYRNLNIKFSTEKKPMGTLYAIKNFWKDIDDDVIIKNGDTITYYNLDDFYDFSRNNNYGATMSVGNMKSPSGVIKMEKNRIIGFSEKPEIEIQVNTGLYYFSRLVKDIFMDNYERKSLEETVFPVLVNDGLLYGYDEFSEWYPVDNFKDYDEIKKIYRSRKDTEFGYVDGNKKKGKMLIMKNKIYRTDEKYSYKVERGLLQNRNFRYQENASFVGDKMILKALKTSIISYYRL